MGGGDGKGEVGGVKGEGGYVGKQEWEGERKVHSC